MQGKTINGFELKRLLGMGGMAEVWYAENEIGMIAAVKILSKELSNNDVMKDRFLNEAKVMVKLNHPNIRKVFGYGSIDERPCIIMEYLDGNDLKNISKRGRRFSDEELRKWWNQLVDALGYTHKQGIVHRDIKPSNIFIDKNGDSKLLDFGIAKVLDTSSGTLTGSTLGTRIYMSPEQVKDPKRVGAPSDAYSLAVSFVHLITGRAPYDTTTSSDYDIQVSIVTKPIDLSMLPTPWQEMLAPYLEKEADKRPALRPFVEQKKPEQSVTPQLEDDATVMTMPVNNKTTVSENNTLQPMPTATKRKSSIVPWIVAGAACLAAVVMALLGLRGKSGDDVELLVGVNDGIQSANVALANQINQKYTTFEEQYGRDPENLSSYWDQAQALREKATDFINHAEWLKYCLVDETDGSGAAALYSTDTVRYGRSFYPVNLSSVTSKVNTSKPTEILLRLGAAMPLRDGMSRFREQVESIVGSNQLQEVGLMTDPWDYDDSKFKDKSLAEDVTIINKMISEVQTAELNVVSRLMSDINVDDYDEKAARVFAESGYLLSGQTYRAQAMVTAWKNAQLTARVKLDGGAEREYTSNAQGVIPLEWNVGVGSHSYTGIIDMLNPSTKQMEEYPFQGTFTVAPPAVSVSPTKMNVVYRGIDNPIAVGGGVGGEIKATASSGTLTKTGNGTYNLRPGDGIEVTISVSSGGSSLGSMKFRVKDLPKPVATIRNVANGRVSKSALLAANRVDAEMKDFDFDGVKYDVVGYTMLYKTKSGTTKEAKANGGTFTEEMKSAINMANVGDTFLFTDIQVRGNDGKTKSLDMTIGVEIK